VLQASHDLSDVACGSNKEKVISGTIEHHGMSNSLPTRSQCLFSVDLHLSAMDGRAPAAVQQADRGSMCDTSKHVFNVYPPSAWKREYSFKRPSRSDETTSNSDV
jgi:hypothetical protein